MKKRLILASSSPRRKEMFSQIGFDFDVIPSAYEEDMGLLEDPYELAKLLALKKGEDVAKNVKNAIVVSADTFVVFDGVFLGKPKSEKDARRLLRLISGKTVHVVSGYSVIDTEGGEVVNDYGVGDVIMMEMSDQDIERYIKTGEPLDKAGAFGIQGYGSIFIESISGDYYSILAMPIGKVYREVMRMMT